MPSKEVCKTCTYYKNNRDGGHCSMFTERVAGYCAPFTVEPEKTKLKLCSHRGCCYLPLADGKCHKHTELPLHIALKNYQEAIKVTTSLGDYIKPGTVLFVDERYFEEGSGRPMLFARESAKTSVDDATHILAIHYDGEKVTYHWENSVK